MFIKRLETHAATMVSLVAPNSGFQSLIIYALQPETAPQNELPAALGAFAPPATNGSSQATIASSAAGAAGALAGWAISSLGKKVRLSSPSIQRPKTWTVYGSKYVLIILGPLDHLERDAVQYRTRSLRLPTRPTTRPKLDPPRTQFLFLRTSNTFYAFHPYRHQTEAQRSWSWGWDA